MDTQDVENARKLILVLAIVLAVTVVCLVLTVIWRHMV